MRSGVTIQGIQRAPVGNIWIHAFESVEDAVSCILPAAEPLSGFAVAINPEKVVASLTDREARCAIEAANVRYADGIGVVWAIRRHVRGAGRVPGCDLWEKLMGRAGEAGVPVYLIGARPDVVRTVRDRLKAAYGVQVVGARDGFFSPQEVPELISDVRESRARIVCVAMGSPKQEKFIGELMVQHPDCFYMGVGGTFDVYAGTVKRAPPAWRNAHLEWLYRLLREPRRIKRYGPIVRFAWLLTLGRL